MYYLKHYAYLLNMLNRWPRWASVKHANQNKVKGIKFYG
jgi:hypothetical protein